jgi:hypothetical protein
MHVKVNNRLLVDVLAALCAWHALLPVDAYPHLVQPTEARKGMIQCQKRPSI